MLFLLFVGLTYDIEATLHGHTVSAEERVTWQNTSSAAVDRVYLHLYLNAFQPGSSLRKESGDEETEPQDDGRIVITRLQQEGVDLASDFVQPDGGPLTDRTVLVVLLKDPLAPGGTAVFDIAFESELPHATQRSGYEGDFHLVAQWFPKLAVLESKGWNAHEYHAWSEFYADFADYDVRLHVPDGFETAAVGERVAPGHYKQSRVHDFAWMAAPGVELLIATWNHVRIEVWFPSEYRTAGERCRDQLLESLPAYESALVPYPYRTLTCIVPPYHADGSIGGMEYPTFFTSQHSTLVPHHLNATIAHEFGHNYFYGLVATNEFEEPFLDEGLNQYFENTMPGPYEMFPAFLRPLGIWKTTTLEELQHEGSWEVLDALSATAWQRRSHSSYYSIYDRGQAVLATLERLLPPGELALGMKHYVETWANAHPHLSDLERALAEHTQRPEVVRDVFAKFVYDTQAIDDRVAEVSEHEVVVERHRAQLPQTLLVHFDDDSEETLTWAAPERWHRFTFDKSVTWAHLDPERRLLLDKSKLDDVRTRERKDVLWPMLQPFVHLLATLLVLG